jgi:hypothetical protein
MGPLMQALAYLKPRIAARAEKETLHEAEILAFLANTTLVGVVRSPPDILLRRYVANAYTDVWFSTYLWGIVFLRNLEARLVLRYKVSWQFDRVLSVLNAGVRS